jgi:hypothetical protein
VIEEEAQEREARSEHPEVAGEQLGGGEQGRSGADASADPSLGASGTEMGPTLGAQAGGSGATGVAQNPMEEDTEEIEEIPHPPEEEEVHPQRIQVARQRHNEWVFHEEDWSGASSRQIRHTLEKLYSQVQVPLCRFPIVGDGFLSTVDVLMNCLCGRRSWRRPRSTANGASIQ